MQYLVRELVSHSSHKMCCFRNYLISVSQVLQLRRFRPPRKRVQVASSAKKMSFLPECLTHGCQLPNQSPAVLTRLSGNTFLFEGGGRRTELFLFTHRDHQLRQECTEVGMEFTSQSFHYIKKMNMCSY